jgi:two-component system, chemotaxis family, chemotaxis protein CheY
MKILIVEDDFTSRKLLQKILSEYGECDIAVDGEEAIKAFNFAHEDNTPYNLICMDIMMPNVDGHEALSKIRETERKLGVTDRNEVKVIMTTALDDPKNVMKALYKEGATSYLVKPVGKQIIFEEIVKLGLMKV